VVVGFGGVHAVHPLFVHTPVVVQCVYNIDRKVTICIHCAVLGYGSGAKTTYYNVTLVLMFQLQEGTKAPLTMDI